MTCIIGTLAVFLLSCLVAAAAAVVVVVVAGAFVS
jgi:hypothetical protein